MRRRCPGLVLAALTAVMLAAAPAQGRVRCSSGVTVVQDRTLRIFAVADVRHDVHLYACHGHRGPVAGVGDDAKLVAFDGRRYLAELDVSVEGEGGGDATYYVEDLRTGRPATFANAVFPGDEPLHPFRVTPAGALARDDYGVQLVPRGYKRDTLLIPPVGTGNEIAYVGDRIYWTDDAAARSAHVAAPAATPENRVYDLQRTDGYTITHRRGRCARLRGVTIAASGSVRVVARRSRSGRTLRRACAFGRSWRRALGPRAGAQGELRIVADRWLLSRTAAGVAIIDAHSGAIVTKVVSPIGAYTLAGDGTFAWIDPTGELLARPPRTTAPTVLADAATTPVALAASDATIYWTSGGVAMRWQR